MTTKLSNILTTKSLVEQGVITAPVAFMEALNSDLVTICNGCGAADAKFDFIPDTMWGMCICEACHIHDFEYDIAETWQQKKEADGRFLLNLLYIINHRSRNLVMRSLRSRRALKYYRGVHEAGDDAFKKAILNSGPIPPS